MTTNLFIDKILFASCKAFFKGTFSCDNIPISSLANIKEYCIVCNFSRVGTKGTHFITIIKKEFAVHYVDSLGLPCIQPQLLAFLEQLKLPISCNRIQFQAADSMFCGFYAIFFCLFDDRKLSQKEKNKFVFTSTDLVRNDKHVVKYICKLFKIERKINI